MRRARTQHVSRASKASVEDFFSAKFAGKRYLFGCNEHSAALAERVDIAGFVDDFRGDALFCGKPVLHGDSVPRGAAVVNCVFCARSLMARSRIDKLNVTLALEYADLLRHAQECALVPEFVSDTRADLRIHGERWEKVAEMLSDKESKKVLRDLINFRTSGSLDFLEEYSFRPKEQYFEQFCPLKPGEVFVDCGGFDGDTAEQFVLRCPDYRKVWLFEPSSANMCRAELRLASYRDVCFVAKAVGDRPHTVCFDSSAGTSSAVSESGDTLVEVGTLDQEIDERVTLIKMDLEGWELKALKGARRHIERDHPKLAIAVYHQASDFWRVPEQVLGVRDDYNIYLRHYTEGWSETVMYFIPHS